MKLITSKGAGNSLSRVKTQFTKTHLISKWWVTKQYSHNLELGHQTNIQAAHLGTISLRSCENYEPVTKVQMSMNGQFQACLSDILTHEEYTPSVPKSPSLQITCSCWQGIDAQITWIKAREPSVSPLPPPVSPRVPTEADKMNQGPGNIHNLCDPPLLHPVLHFYVQLTAMPYNLPHATGFSAPQCV